jgi:anti-sigma B factor antagonist
MQPSANPQGTRREMLSRKDKTGHSPSSAASFAVSRRALDERTSVISVEGELDLSTAPQLKWALLDSAQAGHSQLVVDLSGATFMDSTALGVLIGVKRGLDAGARLALVCEAPSILNVFELSGMDGAFAIYATLEDALAPISGQAAEAG